MVNRKEPRPNLMEFKGLFGSEEKPKTRLVSLGHAVITNVDTKNRESISAVHHALNKIKTQSDAKLPSELEKIAKSLDDAVTVLENKGVEEIKKLLKLYQSAVKFVEDELGTSDKGKEEAAKTKAVAEKKAALTSKTAA